MSVGGGGGVFVSYRRGDGGDAAGRLADHLVIRFGAERVFMDVDAIEPGIDYVEALTRAVEACAVLIAVISPGWVTAADRRGRRLDDPHDWVRVEVGTALARGVRVIPVLVGGADMPDRGDLPDDLAGLARRNGYRIRHESFRVDAGQLVAVIERVLASAAPVAVDAEAPVPVGHGPPGAREGAGTGQEDAARAARLLAEAERIAASIASEDVQASALCDVAAAVAITDPGHAAWLFGDAERAISSITNEAMKALALSDVAAAMAATEPGRAERIANMITDEAWKASALSKVASAMGATDPDGAERIANVITDEAWKASALSSVASAMAATDPGRAERIANSITSDSPKTWALHDVARAVAATDPGRAERIANSITSESWKAWTLNAVATVIAATDPDGAERIANSITADAPRASALASVAKALTSA
jgi:hypothetical protein